MTDTSLARSWDDLVAVALVGTDRRDPPAPPSGPIAEFALEAPSRDAAGSLVQQVAAITVVQRAAGRARPPATPLAAAPVDPRPMCTPDAAALLERIVVEWPMLESDWLHVARVGGWRLSPDLVPMLLRRHRADPDTRALVVELAGPVADWLVDHVDGLAPTARRGPSRPAVALPPELAAVVDAPVAEVVAVIADGLRRQRYTMASRAVVVHLVARLPIDTLAPLATALDALDPDLPGRGLVHHLIDLVEVRLAVSERLHPKARHPDAVQHRASEETP